MFKKDRIIYKFALGIRYFFHFMGHIRFLIIIRPFLREAGRGATIKSPLFITPECIRIGDNVQIMNGCRIEGVYAYAGQRFDPDIFFDEGVTLQQRCHITSANKVSIGKKTMISFDVSIQDTDHEYRDIEEPVESQPLIVCETIIGENCFIGSGAKLQAGTVLGKHCVVGTNAVVRGCFPDFSVIVGVPARVVKRFNVITGQWEKTNKKGEFLSEL